MIVCSQFAYNQFISPDLHNRMWTQFQQWYSEKKFCDVVISCNNGNTVKAHKQVLAAVSPYFEAILLGPMSSNNNTNGEITVSLDYTSSSLQFFLDCVYEIQKLEAFDVEIVEFTSLCDFLNVPELYREGLRLAAGHLTPENCISELNKATSTDTIPLRKWVTVITRYIANNVNFYEMRFEDIAVEELSFDSIMSLLSSLPFTLHISPLSCELVQQLCKQSMTDITTTCDNLVTHETLGFLSYYVGELTKFLENSEGLKHLYTMVEELKQKHMLICELPLESPIKTVTSPDEIVLQIQYDSPGMSLNYVFYPKLSTVDQKSLIMSRFSRSLDTIRFSAKYFVWRNNLCSVYLEYNEIVVLRYRWCEGTWQPVTAERVRDNIDIYHHDHVTSCTLIKENFLVVATYRSLPEDESHLFLFDLPKQELVSRTSLGQNVPRAMLCEEDTLLLFEHPYLAMKVDFTSEQSFQTVSLPKKSGTVNCRLTSFRGKIYNVYSYSGENGISLAVFNSAKMSWEEQEAKLSEKYTLFGAFAANDNLYVVYGVVEEVSRRVDDDDEDRKVVFISIGQCSFEEIEPGKYEVRLKESQRDPQLDPSSYEKGGVRITVSRNVFPLDDLN